MCACTLFYYNGMACQCIYLPSQHDVSGSLDAVHKTLSASIEIIKLTLHENIVHHQLHTHKLLLLFSLCKLKYHFPPPLLLPMELHVFTTHGLTVHEDI